MNNNNNHTPTFFSSVGTGLKNFGQWGGNALNNLFGNAPSVQNQAPTVNGVQTHATDISHANKIVPIEKMGPIKNPTKGDLQFKTGSRDPDNKLTAGDKWGYGLSTAATAMNTFIGFEQLKNAKRDFKFKRDVFNKNYANLANDRDIANEQQYNKEAFAAGGVENMSETLEERLARRKAV